jgi:hypothetical protein
MGQRIVTLKNQAWRGKTTLNVSDRLERNFLKLENCYVSSDGAEIRHFPGFITLMDLTQQNNPDGGFARYVTDGVKPVFETSPSERYQLLSYQETQRISSLRARAKPTHFHGFEQIGDTLLLWGESRFREVPILQNVAFPTTPPDINDRKVLKVQSISVQGNLWWITLDDTFNAINSALYDFQSCGYNGVSAGNVVYFEGVTVADPVDQAIVDASLNGRVHEIKDSTTYAASNTIVLHTQPNLGSPSMMSGNVACSAGEIHRVRYNRTNVYSTPDGLPIYATAAGNRPDDPQALTSWRVIRSVDPDNTAPECFPAWVANRTRDFGDAFNNPAIAYQDTEGWWLTATGTRGVSRREQRRLPYRTNPEAAQDRLILAAPAYGCLFQIPLKVPINPQNWPFTPTDAEVFNYGIQYHCNDIYDKPRSLGLPKARLIDSIFTPAMESPNSTPIAGFNFSAIPVAADTPTLGLPAGEYLVSISFEDEALNEEGLASEPITVTIPAGGFAYTIGIHYIHPGYIMPECLATKINVYIAPPGESAMAFYTSFPLGARPYLAASIIDTNYDASARYGFPSVSPSNPYAFLRQWQLPLPDQQSDLSQVIDATRLAPQSASMPRGAEAARYIKGTLIAGGHTGNTGGSLQLWESKASIVYTNSTHKAYDEMIIRRHDKLSANPDAADVDGDSTTSTLGCAGRSFPDAYSGIEVTSLDLFPSGSINQQVDKVMNPRATDLRNDPFGQPHWEFVKLTRPIVGYQRESGSPEEVPSAYTRYERSVWYRMQKGQIQVSDPGAPHRSNKSAIQFIDPNKGDDVTAIGTLAGSAIICSRRETYSMAWYRAPAGEVPQLVSNEHGCIAANSMVEFDGGLAWIGERGPVAMGGGLQWIGEQVAQDFYGTNARYAHDSRGMMRHAWACHDASRGLVMWGLATKDGVTSETNSVEDDGVTYNWSGASDELKSRWPCDEVLIWSYRSGAFSTWRPPTGLEILWMRPIRVASGELVVAFLAKDGRLYGLYDDKNDTTRKSNIFQATSKGSNDTTITLDTSTIGFASIDGELGSFGSLVGRSQGAFFRTGMLVEQLDDNGEIVAERVISSIDSKTSTTITVTLSGSCTWTTTTKWRVGGRQKATILSTFIGMEAMDNMAVQGVQMRYNLYGAGSANAKVTLIKSDYLNDETIPKTVTAGGTRWQNLGESILTESSTQGRRRRFQDVGIDGEEVAVKIELTGTAQCRITDIGLEVQ